MAVHWRRSDGLASRMPPTDPKKRPPFSPSRISPAAPRRRPLPATISGAAWSVPTKPGSGWMATPPPLCCSPDSATARRCGGRDGGTGKRASGFCLRSAWLRRQSGQRGTARSLHRCRRTARPAPNCRPATALRAGRTLAGRSLSVRLRPPRRRIPSLTTTQNSRPAKPWSSPTAPTRPPRCRLTASAWTGPSTSSPISMASGWPAHRRCPC